VSDSFLETERLILRRFRQADRDNLVELDSDPEVMRYLNGGLPTPRAVVESDILPRFLRYDAGCGGCFAAIEKVRGAFIGWFSLYAADGDGTFRLGYRLRRSAWGKGYATEGARALIRTGFVDLGMRRVEADTYEYNVASRRVMEKVGMSLVRSYRPTAEEIAAGGTFVSAGEVWDGDEVVYALDRVAWEQREKWEQRAAT